MFAHFKKLCRQVTKQDQLVTAQYVAINSHEPSVHIANTTNSNCHSSEDQLFHHMDIKISQFVDTQAKHLVPEIPSYIQDTPDLLRHLEQFKNTRFPEGIFPVSIDVVGLYNNIPNEEGLKAFEETLNTRKDQSIPTDLLIKLKRVVLTKNSRKSHTSSGLAVKNN